MINSNEQRIQQKVDEAKSNFEERISKIQEKGNETIHKLEVDSPDESGIPNFIFDNHLFKNFITSSNYNI